MAGNIPIFYGTLRLIHAFNTDALYATITPSGPRNIFLLNCHEGSCNPPAGKFSIPSSGPLPITNLGTF